MTLVAPNMSISRLGISTPVSQLRSQCKFQHVLQRTNLFHWDWSFKLAKLSRNFYVCTYGQAWMIARSRISTIHSARFFSCFLQHWEAEGPMQIMWSIPSQEIFKVFFHITARCISSQTDKEQRLSVVDPALFSHLKDPLYQSFNMINHQLKFACRQKPPSLLLMSRLLRVCKHSQIWRKFSLPKCNTLNTSMLLTFGIDK